MEGFDVKHRGMRKRRMTGQGMTEFLVVAPLLLFFGFVTVQFVLLYQAKSTLDVALLEAAREGAVNHGSMETMQAGLARGLAPLYTRSADAGGVQAALRAAQRAVGERASIEIVSPTVAMMRDFARPRFYPAEGVAHDEIPNDMLMYRDTTHGAESDVNVQDANLLKLRVHYCFDLIVPVANKVLYYATNTIGDIAANGVFSREPAQASVDAYGSPKRPDSVCRTTLVDGGQSQRWPVALESEAIVRMQSPFRAEAANEVHATVGR
ncbi:TadE/TadG family type IV pilus assembly protein [Paraburkholderia caribensis]|uniref:TadE/TadG family type IV pilus assembly protein n=1 Tax=Paraburkholderia caribensis TaxID=75105 RepID=UPI001CAB0CE6|nr:TadE family protein [Paraburkholderia caribensis]CAG9270962.1 Pilus assembly protein TadE [Paraburkholderia caribensis]